MTDTPTIPGPPDRTFGMKAAMDFANDPISYLQNLVDEYGDIARARFGPTFYSYTIRNPDYVRQVMISQSKKIRKWERQTEVIRKISGEGTFVSEGDFWRRQRRLIQPAFHTNRIKAYIELMLNHAERMLTSWEGQQTVAASYEMSKVTMGIISDILFDIKDLEKDADVLYEAINVSVEMIGAEITALMPIPDWVPTPRNRRENQAMATLDRFILELISQRRATSKDHGDVLSALLMVVDDEHDNIPMTDQQVRDELMTLFIAGHETTAMALTWTLYLLARHPDVQERLYEEVHRVLSDGRLPTLADLETMTYTDQVLREAMRLYPPAWAIIVREAIEDVQIGDYTVPAGGLIVISPWLLHHDPRVFPQPDRFDPERFAGDWRKRYPNYAYIPFGVGERTCSGSHMAMMEGEVLLAAMINNYRFELVDDRTIEPEPLLTVRPKNDIQLRIIKR